MNRFPSFSMADSKGKRKYQLNLFQLDYGSRHNVFFLLASAQNNIHILSYNPNVGFRILIRLENFGSITLMSLNVLFMGLGKEPVPMFVFSGFFMNFSLCAY